MIPTLIDHLHGFAIPTPYSVGDVNVYLLEPGRPGETLTLLDTGPNWEPGETALRQGLAELGYSVADIGQILISHPHPDHYGLAAKLVTESGAAVQAHPHGLDTLTAGDSAHQRAYDFYQHWLTGCGVPAEIQLEIAQARQSTHSFALPVNVDRWLNDGDQISMAGLDWQVLATPGHSGAMLCFFQTETGVMLTSDHLIDDISSNPVVEPPPIGLTQRPKRLLQYLQQLERVADLHPTIAYSGHGRPVVEIGQVVQQRKAFHQARAEKVLKQLQTQPQSVFQLATQLFQPNLPSLHLFLALSEIQGHLDLLEKEGLVISHHTNRAILWTAVS